MTVLASIALLSAFAWLLALAHELDNAPPVLATARILLLQTSFGPAWIARLAFAGTAVAAAIANQRRLALAASAAMLICEGWDGHAAAHGLFGEMTQSLHVLCAGVWIGGLFALAKLLSSTVRRETQLAPALSAVRCFSDVALGAVVLLFATGVVNALLLGPGVDFTGSYVRLLAIKVFLFTLMLAFAAFNRFRTVPRLDLDKDRSALKTLLFTTGCEQALGFGVLLAVAALGLLDPYMPNM